MLNRGQRLYVAFTCVATGAIAVALYVILVASELVQPAAQIDWVVAAIRLVECCALFYGVTYLAGHLVYRRIGATPELEHLADVSNESLAWLNGAAALSLLVGQITLAVRAGALEFVHFAWITVAGVLLIQTIRAISLADQREVDREFELESKTRLDPALAE